jgi:dehydrogenase/reductase SDR family member 12
MPSTTETTTIDRPAAEVFPRVADFAKLSEWDPVFDTSRRLDDGPMGVGSSFLVSGTTAGREVELILTITRFEPPNRVTFDGTGDGLRTTERIEVADLDDGRCEVTYHSSFETNQADLAEAAMQVPFWLVGKATMRHLDDWLTDDA